MQKFKSIHFTLKGLDRVLTDGVKMCTWYVFPEIDISVLGRNHELDVQSLLTREAMKNGRNLAIKVH